MGYDIARKITVHLIDGDKEIYTASKEHPLRCWITTNAVHVEWWDGPTEVIPVHRVERVSHEWV